MPNYTRAHQPGGTFFFTLTTHHRQQVLLEPAVIAALRESLRQAKLRNPFTVNAWVILPDHMHFIWTLAQNDADYSRKWGTIKAGVTRRIKNSFKPASSSNLSRLKRGEGSLWQRRFWEHQIRDGTDFKAHLDYLHYNPVKHGLVARVREWPQSSFHAYVQRGAYGGDWGAASDLNIGLGE
jgi:putative transposase